MRRSLFSIEHPAAVPGIAASRRRSLPRIRRWAAGMLVIGAIAGIAGCDRSDPAPPAPSPPQAIPGTDTPDAHAGEQAAGVVAPGGRASETGAGTRPNETLSHATRSGSSAEGDKRPYQDAAPGHVQLVDVLESSGIDFVHTDGGGERQYIIQTVVAGLALFDYDGDGWIDIYFLNGGQVPGNPLATPPTNKLYRNNGDWTFTDVTAAAGVGDTGYGLGVATADYDNDGDQDIYVNNFGPNVLYRNNGDGTFTDVTGEAGVQCDKVGAGVAFADFDRDGDLDLYVANYVDFTYDNYRSRKVGKYEFAAAPSDYEPQTDVLFRNNGDGTFTDISVATGLDRYAGPSMGIIATDYDRDRDIDVMVCCDNEPNLLLRNDGMGRFEEVGVLSGIAHDARGADNGSMGVDAGDYDNDGNIDLVVTNYQGEMTVLYRNVDGGFFTDVSQVTRAGASSFPHVKWGTTLADFDVDGDRDLFIACGHFIEHIRFLDDRTRVRVPNFLLENLGNGRFQDISHQSGRAMGIAESSKGAAFDDLDNDGDIDVVILNANSRPTLMRNDIATERHGLLISLIGVQTNRDGVGARVTVTAGGKTQVAEVYSGRGYQSDYGRRVHFGLADATRTDRIEVDWMGGKQEIYEDLPAARWIELREGGGHRVVK